MIPLAEILPAPGLTSVEIVFFVQGCLVVGMILAGFVAVKIAKEFLR